MLEFEALNYRMGRETKLDFAVSLVGILVSLEVCRRVLGLSLMAVVERADYLIVVDAVKLGGSPGAQVDLEQVKEAIKLFSE